MKKLYLAVLILVLLLVLIVVVKIKESVGEKEGINKEIVIYDNQVSKFGQVLELEKKQKIGFQALMDNINNVFKEVDWSGEVADEASLVKEEITVVIAEQAVADFKYNELLNKHRENNPWVDKLPIKTDEYNIVFDYKKQKFRVKFTREINTYEFEYFKQKVFESLSEIGVIGFESRYYFMMPSNIAIEF